MARVRPTANGIRLRQTPVDGKPIGQVYEGDSLEVMETPAEAEGKIGVQGQWLKVRTTDGTVGYVAAWFVRVEQEKGTGAESGGAESGAKPGPAPAPTPPRVTSIMGVNLDNFHPQGTPDPQRLGGLGWVRFGYNVSAGKGSEDIDAAYATYRPLAERYARAGYKVLFCFTHQTYGEGKNEFWPWPDMTSEKWRTLTARFADMARRIAAQYANQDLVHAWQIWNEQDAPIGAVASVPMPPRDYAHLLSETIRTIRSVDSQVAIITGGHTRGPVVGALYARDTLAAMPADVRPDGIAFHPYGRGTEPETRYANWGHIDESLRAYLEVMPDKPVWITEWGALDKEGDPPEALAKYASDFVGWIRQRYDNRVAAAIWYAWAMGMHNGYGLVGRDDRPLEPLYSKFLTL